MTRDVKKILEIIAYLFAAACCVSGAPENKEAQNILAKEAQFNAEADTEQICYKLGYDESEPRYPSVCDEGYEQAGWSCYKKCDEGYEPYGELCWESCGTDFRDAGAYCAAEIKTTTETTEGEEDQKPPVVYKKATYSRVNEEDTERTLQCANEWETISISGGSSSSSNNNKKKQQQQNGIGICYRACPEGYVRSGLSCVKKCQGKGNCCMTRSRCSEVLENKGDLSITSKQKTTIQNDKDGYIVQYKEAPPSIMEVEKEENNETAEDIETPKKNGQRRRRRKLPISVSIGHGRTKVSHKNNRYYHPNRWFNWWPFRPIHRYYDDNDDDDDDDNESYNEDDSYDYYEEEEESDNERNEEYDHNKKNYLSCVYIQDE